MGIKSPKAVREQRKRSGYYKGYYVRQNYEAKYCVVAASGEVIDETFETDKLARSFIDRMRTSVKPLITIVINEIQRLENELAATAINNINRMAIQHAQI